VFGALGVTIAVIVLVIAWQLAEDRGLRIPILGALADLTERWVLALAGAVVPLAVFGFAYLLLEPKGVAFAVPVALAVFAAAAPGVVRRWREHRDGQRRAPARSLPNRRRRATRLDSIHEEGWRLLGEHRYGAAAALYRQAAELGDVDAMVNLANLLADELGRSSDAESWYRRAIDGGNALAAVNLALLMLDQDRVEEARELFEFARRGGEPAGYIGLAHVAFENDELERARALLEIAVMEGDLDAYAPLGEVLVSMDRDAEAEQRLREGLAAGARGAAHMLARVLRVAGRNDEADALRDTSPTAPENRWPPE
jgi:TPR repeat protein